MAAHLRHSVSKMVKRNEHSHIAILLLLYCLLAAVTERCCFGFVTQSRSFRIRSVALSAKPQKKPSSSTTTTRKNTKTKTKASVKKTKTNRSGGGGAQDIKTRLTKKQVVNKDVQEFGKLLNNLYQQNSVKKETMPIEVDKTDDPKPSFPNFNRKNKIGTMSVATLLSSWIQQGKDQKSKSKATTSSSSTPDVVVVEDVDDDVPASDRSIDLEQDEASQLVADYNIQLEGESDDEEESAKQPTALERSNFQQKLLEARIKYDATSTRKRIEQREEQERLQRGTKAYQFQQRLLQARIRNDQSKTEQTKRLYKTRKQFEFQQRLLRARIENDRTKARLQRQQREEEKRPERAKKQFLFQQRLLRAQFENVQASKAQYEGDSGEQFQRRLLEARIKNDRAKLRVVEIQRKYEEMGRLKTEEIEDTGVTAKYVTSFEAATQGSLRSMMEDEESLKEIRLKAKEEKARLEAMEQNAAMGDVQQSTSAPHVGPDQLVGQVLLDKYVISGKVRIGGDKCEVFTAFHTMDYARKDPLIVKLSLNNPDNIGLEYRIHKELFDLLQPEETHLFVRPYDWIDPQPATNGKAGFVMECGIENLRGYIYKHGAYTGDRLKQVMWSVIRTVYALHRLGTVWTELKAENFIVFGDGSTVKGADLESVAHYQGNIRVYTAETYPPEFPIDILYKALPDLPLDYSFDIWGLGMALFEIATGGPLFTLQKTYDVEYIKTRLRNPDGIVGEAYNKLENVDPGARNVIMKCLRVDPSLRPSCEELLRDTYFLEDVTQTAA